MTDDERLAEIRARLVASSPPPWEVCRRDLFDLLDEIDGLRGQLEIQGLELLAARESEAMSDEHARRGWAQADRLRRQRRELQDEVVGLRGDRPHDWQPIDWEPYSRRRWSCADCGAETDAPVRAYYDPCPGRGGK